MKVEINMPKNRTEALPKLIRPPSRSVTMMPMASLPSVACSVELSSQAW